MLQFPNNYKFNSGNELNESFGINLYETFYRLQDVQTGRFLNTDPYAEKYFGLTPYNYAANNPVSINDPLGDQMKYPGDTGRMQKGPDGNYHTGWVSEMMWNEKGFFNYGEVYGFSGGDFGSSHALYNIRGKSSQSFLNQKQLLDDNAIWDVGKAQFGYWRYNSFDPRNNGYQEAAASGDQLQEVVVGTGKVWVAFEDNLKELNNYLGYANQLEIWAGATQLGMLEYRKAMPIVDKIGTFSKFSNFYRTFGFLGKVGGYGGYAGAAVTTVIDYNDYKSEKISGTRLSFRTTGTFVSIGSSIAVGNYFGGPYGALAGAIVSSNFWAAEVSYDATNSWINQASAYLNNIRNSISNGWFPSF